MPYSCTKLTGQGTGSKEVLVGPAMGANCAQFQAFEHARNETLCKRCGDALWAC